MAIQQLGHNDEGDAIITQRPVAFFDVDETLITVKSMFEFLRYWMARTGDDGTGYRHVAAELHAMADSGMHRTAINREYYRRFAGVAVADLRSTGREWYAEYREQPTAFIASTLAATVWHRAAGHRIALVSGSFRACLEPLAEDLLADVVVCTEPIVGADGRLTGEVPRPMIGAAKAAAVEESLAQLGARAADCFGYADHASDLGMLACVGHPSVVGEDPVLIAHATRHGWPVLPAVPSPLPVHVVS